MTHLLSDNNAGCWVLQHSKQLAPAGHSAPCLQSRPQHDIETHLPHPYVCHCCCFRYRQQVGLLQLLLQVATVCMVASFCCTTHADLLLRDMYTGTAFEGITMYCELRGLLVWTHCSLDQQQLLLQVTGRPLSCCCARYRCLHMLLKTPFNTCRPAWEQYCACTSIVSEV